MLIEITALVVALGSLVFNVSMVIKTWRLYTEKKKQYERRLREFIEKYGYDPRES